MWSAYIVTYWKETAVMVILVCITCCRRARLISVWEILLSATKRYVRYPEQASTGCRSKIDLVFRSVALFLCILIFAFVTRVSNDLIITERTRTVYGNVRYIVCRVNEWMSGCMHWLACVFCCTNAEHLLRDRWFLYFVNKKWFSITYYNATSALSLHRPWR